jgi:predicted Fe-Mo cluster-binding NifX family protein
MPWRVAITSADGVLINQHFGHATWFYIVDIARDGGCTVAERRDTVPWCTAEAARKDAEPGDSGIADAITDCLAVLTARIGPPARKKLELAGLAVFEEPAPIDEAARKLAAYYAKTGRAENGGPFIRRGP